jgi:LmbE family N-acetylglucosaminyl deacetylase
VPSATSSLEALVRPETHLFLSPHYDDIALSTGGVVRTLADAGRHPETIVIFGSEPDPGQKLTPFATAMHEGWGLDASQVIASRQAEERVASGHLGASQRVLPLRDAIYREDYYLSDEDLFGPPHPAEAEVPQAIIAALGLPAAPDPNVRIYAPLAIGNHVDHQHAFNAALRLARAGWDIWFYEDSPYSLSAGALDTRLAEVAAATSMSQAALIPVEPAWEAKIDAIMSYPSQLDTIFRVYVGISPTRAGISKALRARSLEIGEGTLVERFWKVNESR